MAFVSGAFVQEGHKQTLQTTLAIYNSIFEGSGDTRKIYRDLTKAIEGTEKRREDVRKKVSEMENEAHKFFAEWTESLDKIGSEVYANAAKNASTKPGCATGRFSPRDAGRAPSSSLHGRAS